MHETRSELIVTDPSAIEGGGDASEPCEGQRYSAYKRCSRNLVEGESREV
jgi:hypothetical protein